MDTLLGLSRFLSLTGIARLVGLGGASVSMLRLDEARTLLEHDWLSVETGYGFTDDGMAHVAASTYMKDVTPEMIEWFFGWVQDTERYKLWHPRDHISGTRTGPPGQYIGYFHRVEEYIAGKPSKLQIAFKDPSQYFGDDWKEQFRQKDYGTAICARTGVWDEGKKKYTDSGHLIHLVKIEPDGCRMRSRFWLGDVEGVPIKVGKMVPDHFMQGLVKHCVEEMSILASILPELYRKETGAKPRM